MRGISELRRSLRSVAGAAIDRIRRYLPGPLGRSSAGAGGATVEEVAVDPGGETGGDGTAMTRQSTRRSPTALEDPARFDDPTGDGSGGPAGDAESDDGDGVVSGPEPLDGLSPRDRPLPEPTDGSTNGTRTVGENRPDGRFRIVDPENEQAYVESDASVVLDHVR